MVVSSHRSLRNAQCRESRMKMTLVRQFYWQRMGLKVVVGWKNAIKPGLGDDFSAYGAEEAINVSHKRHFRTRKHHERDADMSWDIHAVSLRRLHWILAMMLLYRAAVLVRSCHRNHYLVVPRFVPLATPSPLKWWRPCSRGKSTPAIRV